jgi:hypothetical protein
VVLTLNNPEKIYVMLWLQSMDPELRRVQRRVRLLQEQHLLQKRKTFLLAKKMRMQNLTN